MLRRKTEFGEMDFALKALALKIKKYAYFDFCPKLLNSKENSRAVGFVRSKPYCKHVVRKQHVARLRKDLRSACTLIKTLKSENANEVNVLKKLLTYARSECVDLLQRYKSVISKAINLHDKNQSLNEYLESINGAIQNGYENLNAIYKLSPTDYESSTLDKLKKLIDHYSHFNTDIISENDASCKMQQCSFLKNRIFILEINIDAVKHQLNALELQNSRLRKENLQLKAQIKSVSTDENTDTLAINVSGNKIYRNSGDSLLHVGKPDLTNHMRIISRLLTDQDTMLNDFHRISEELASI